MENQGTASSQRRYQVYFNTVGKSYTPTTIPPQVILTDDVIDAGQLSYQIQTSTATYFYHKAGGGFSSLVDKDGNDWINHSDAAGSAGEYRGIPNLVYPDDGGYFHPRQTGVVSTVLTEGPLKVKIHSSTADNAWETLWEIYPNYAQLTVLKAATNYWFLYEGTLGGSLEVVSDFIIRSDGTQSLASETWTADIVGDEWLFFGDPTLNRSLYFVHHEADELVDSYYPMNNEMTVFGFG